MAVAARTTPSNEATLHGPAGAEGHPRPALRTVAYVLFPVLAGLLDLPLSTAGLGSEVRGSGTPIPALLPGLAVVAMVVLLMYRRRAPLPVLLGVLAISWALVILVDAAQPLACVLIAVYAAAASSAARRVSLLVLALAFAHGAVTTGSALLTYEDGITVGEFLTPAVAFSIITFTAWGFGRLEAQRAARTQALADELARSNAATFAERQRIARELHDILAHSVSAMMMQAAGARAVAGSLAADHDDERIRPVVTALGTIEATGSQSLRELHRLLGVMREAQTTNPLDLDSDLSGGSSSQPGLDDLDDVMQTSRASGLIVEHHRTGQPGTLDPSVGAAAYRVVQESLTNALKHAGSGAVVDIYESWEDATVQLQVRSRAASTTASRPDAPNSGAGLPGLRERVQLAGGSFEVGRVGDEWVTTTRLPTRPRASGMSGTGERPEVRP